MIFVDTSVWYSMVVETDEQHAAVNAFLADNRLDLLTTDYIVDETLTLLRARSRNSRAIKLGKAFFEHRIAIVHKITEDDLAEAWNIFQSYDDKEWSYTDCTSKVIIEKLGITTALSLDHHFQQFGSVAVFP